MDIVERYSNLFEFYPSGKIAGFKLSQVLEIANVLGYNTQTILMLIPFVEQGLLDASNTQEEELTPVGIDRY